jgi:hypothetical protein
MGVFQSAGSLARVVGPVCAGLFYDQIGHGTPFYSGSLVLALGVLITGTRGLEFIKKNAAAKSAAAV